MTGRILVVDHSRHHRERLRLALESGAYGVAVADSDGAVRASIEFTPDLVLVDLCRITGDEGVTICRRIRDVTDTPIVFLSAAERPAERIAAFEVGADEFIPKDVSPDELLWRVHAVLRRGSGRQDDILCAGDLVIDESAHRARRGDHALDLTPREFALLVVLVRHRGRVLSKQALLRDVWSFDGYDSNVVEVHMSALRRKLEAAGPRLVHTIRSIGYVFDANRGALESSTVPFADITGVSHDEVDHFGVRGAG